MLPASERSKYYYAADYLLTLRDFCFDNNLDFMTALTHAGKSTDLVLNPPLYIPLELFSSICANIAEISSHPFAMGQAFGRQLASKNAHGRLGLAMRNAPDVYHAITLLEQFSETRTNTLLYSVHKDADFIYCFVKPNEGLGEFTEPAIEHFLVLTSLFNIIYFIKKSVESGSKSFDSQLFIEGQLDDFDTLDCGQGIYVRQNVSVNAIRIPRYIGDSRIQFSNHTQLQELTLLLKKELATGPNESLTEHAKYIVRHVGWDHTSIERIASELNISVSTLQRRLREEGTNFKEIKNEERIECAKHHLLFSKNTLEFIAEKLGYSNSSNFSKSFKSAVGMPPADFRKLYQSAKFLP
ncbi:AraC family transcriptional regulator [Marinobacter xestospongiae]|uniref:AraC family transcriptional regulator n=1 Tax=Marinobacter xestospongiae TaxID=994319 RepID=UPI002005B130|nr:AraC family transcriptional regulator [Marinobacter xestospongiae]MCK7568627.1 AraC family transcriptional regulator [Marinobacter xestospongiae]